MIKISSWRIKFEEKNENCKYFRSIKYINLSKIKKIYKYLSEKFIDSTIFKFTVRFFFLQFKGYG